MSLKKSIPVATADADIGDACSKALVSITRHGLKGRADAKQVQMYLKEKGLLPASATYETFVSNHKVTDVLLSHLAFGLPDVVTVATDFGCHLISPWDLRHNCTTDRQLDEFLASIGTTVTPQQLLMLRKSRDELHDWLINLLYDVIKNFNLPGTPNGMNVIVKTVGPLNKKLKKAAGKSLTKNDVEHKNAIAEEVFFIFCLILPFFCLIWTFFKVYNFIRLGDKCSRYCI